MRDIQELISDLQDADKLEKSIKHTKNKIDSLRNKVESEISKLVYACGSPSELGELCDLYGLDNKGYRWGWGRAYDNSYGGDTDYSKQEWCDVLYSTEIELVSHIKKKSREP